MNQSNYEIIKKIGSGSYGSVYLAYDIQNNRNVAIKTISLANTNINEINNLYKLSIPNCNPYVVCFYFSFITDNKINIVTDYIDGPDVMVYTEPLRSFNNTALLIKTGKILLYTMLSALQYIHSKQIIHNDIKPSNIVVGSNRVPVLVDFGISCDINKCNENGGTSLYLSPEVLHGIRTYKSDLWSLAATIYGVVTGNNIWSLNIYQYDARSLMNEVINLMSNKILPNRLSTGDEKLDYIVNNFLQYDPSLRLSINQALALLKDDISHYYS